MFLGKCRWNLILMIESLRMRLSSAYRICLCVHAKALHVKNCTRFLVGSNTLHPRTDVIASIQVSLQYFLYNFCNLYLCHSTTLIDDSLETSRSSSEQIFGIQILEMDIEGGFPRSFDRRFSTNPNAAIGSRLSSYQQRLPTKINNRPA